MLATKPFILFTFSIPACFMEDIGPPEVAAWLAERGLRIERARPAASNKNTEFNVLEKSNYILIVKNRTKKKSHNF